MKNKPTYILAADELEIFREEANDCLAALETGILNLEHKNDPETLNAIFRAAHSLKGLAGAVGHRPMTELTHSLETIFDHLRQGTLSVAQTVIDDLLGSVDLLKALCDEITTQQPAEIDIGPLLNRLQVLVDSQKVPPDQHSLTLDPEESIATGGQPNANMAESTVRISVERLDALMNLVGQLVTDRTHLLQVENDLNARYGSEVSALSQLTVHLNHVVTQLQDEVMRARMLPMGALFSRFPRLVRDGARLAGKQVDLLIEGETTELDRSVIEVIGDPLIHLLRNAVDHGIEPPEERQAAGKSPAGIVHLTASSAEGQIVVTISDDGRGIDPLSIRHSAVNSGLISEAEAAQMSQEELVDLSFRPGLTTATEVTELSGRGVGLDVVRTNLERLGGSVVVTSQLGQGTTFRLTMPLTLALVQAMLVSVHKTVYAIPITSINGSLYLSEAPLKTIKRKPVLEWQTETVPLLDLRQFFSPPKPAAWSENGSARQSIKSSIVRVNWGKLQAGLIVDRIIGQQEIVVKSLSPILGQLPGLSGASILGDGRIALIVDIPGLINAALSGRFEEILSETYAT